MSAAQITAGEWTANYDGGWAVVDSDGDVIADLGSHNQIVVEAGANACLIAVSPTMLAALRATQQMLRSIVLTDEQAEVARQVNEAIALVDHGA